MRVPMPAALTRAVLLAAALTSPALLAGCATTPSDPEAAAEARDANDPIEPTNRFFYRINDGLDTVILRPAAVAYNYILPPTVRQHTHNFLVNLSNPVTLADDMLQGKPRRAGDTLMRLLINSTVGVAGVFDVATDWGYPAHSSDFGVTLALWGFDAGPYLFLPLFGPSDPRDAVGIGGDIALDPFTWIGQGAAVTGLDAGRFALSAIDTRAGLVSTIDQIKSGALDPYATFRSLYRQHRASQIQEIRDDNRATVPDWFPAQPAAPQPVGAPGAPASAAPFDTSPVAVTPSPAPAAPGSAAPNQ